MCAGLFRTMAYASCSRRRIVPSPNLYHPPTNTMRTLFLRYVADRYGGKRGLIRHVWHLAGLYAGVFSRHALLEPRRVQRLMFVCRGNICRSPYAEAVVNRRGLISAASFGLEARTGSPAHDKAIRNARVRGIDLGGHRATSVDDVAIREGDLLVAMEPHHAATLAQRFPAAQVTLLGIWAASRRPFIQDPYSCGDGYYQECFGFIDAAVDGLVRRLRAHN